MELVLILAIILFVICILASVLLLNIRRSGIFETNTEEVLNLFRSELERTEHILDERNKEIDKIESKILHCKKILKMKLFDK